MDFKTSELPGIGKRYSIVTSQGRQIVIITHYNGHREIYYFQDPEDDEPSFSLEFTDEEARQLGAIFLGVDYQPVAEDKMELMLENIRVHWVHVSDNSCLANKTIKETELRKRTGVTIIGIKRGEKLIGSPDVTEKIAPGDVLMVIGKRDPIKEVEKLCRKQNY